MNTLLVNFKETLYSKRENTNCYLEYSLSALGRLVGFVDEDLVIDGIQHFFTCLKQSFQSINPIFAKIMFKKIFALKNQLKLTAGCLKEFNEEFYCFKCEMFKTIIDGRSLSEIKKAYEDLNEVLNDEDIKSIQIIILEYIKMYVKGSKFNEIQFLKAETKEIKNIRACLGSPGSKANKELDSFMREYRNNSIETISENLIEAIKSKEDAAILNEIAKISHELPEFFQKILFEAKSEIVKKPVIFYFLSKRLKVDPPVLSSENKAKAKELEFQFDFFL